MSIGSFLGGIFGGNVDEGDVKNYVSSPGLQSNQFTNRFAGGADAYRTNANNLMGYANPGAQAQTAQQQQAFVNALKQQAAGGGPSVSQTMLQQALQQNAANSTSMAAGARGNNPALAMRQAMQSNAAANQAAVQQGIAARQQEQLNAQGMLGSALSGMRSQDQSNTMGLGQLAQGQGVLAQGQDQLGLDASKANLAGNLTASQINAGIAQGNAASAGKYGGSVFGGIMSGLGGIMGGAVGGGAKSAAMAHGGLVPGEPEVEGDSYANDKVDAKLSPGEIVIPRSKAQNPELAKEFIDHLMKSKKSKESGGFGKVLEAHRKLGEALELIQKKGLA